MRRRSIESLRIFHIADIKGWPEIKVTFYFQRTLVTA